MGGCCNVEGLTGAEARRGSKVVGAARGFTICRGGKDTCYSLIRVLQLRNANGSLTTHTIPINLKPLPDEAPPTGAEKIRSPRSDPTEGNGMTTILLFTLRLVLS